MSASQEQKVDYLLKKIGYVSSKTGIAEDSSLSGTKKAPFAEPISSPLVVPSSFVWSDSSFIPTTPPGSTGTYVEVYATASAYQMTVDTTVSGNRTFIARATAGDSSSAIEGDWIDPSFGSSYVIKVYKGDPNSGGALLPAAGSGSNDTWFFDYSSGVLNFNGTSVPSGVTSTNIYLVGYRYIGAKGIQPPAGIATFNDLHVSGITTLGTVQITSSFSGGIVTALSGVVTYYGDGSNLTGISTDSDKLQGQNGSYYLDYNNFTSTPTIPTVNDATLTLATSGDGISGSDTFTANQESNTTFTVIVSSASTNQANTLVYRDASGGFSAGVVTATSFSGSGAGLTSIPNSALTTSSVSYGGVSLALGSTDATPAFDLSDATNYPTSSLSGTITNAQLAGSIANDKLSNTSVSYGGVSLSLGDTDATPAFDLSDATNYPYAALTGISTNIVGDTTPQLGGNLDLNSKDITGTGNLNVTGVVTATTFSGSGASLTSIPNSALDNSTLSYGGVLLALGASDATPAFNLSDATSYPYASLTGITTNIIGDTTPQLGGNLDANSKDISGVNNLNVSGVSTFTGDVSFGSTATFGDHDRLRFGDGNDLQIYHNGNHSFISDTGTGNLYISGNSLVAIQKSGSSENSAVFNSDGSVELYHDNSKKFETTGIGISVANGAGNTAYIEGPSEIWIDPHPAGVGATSGAVRIRGDLYVDGTEFIVDVDKIELGDFNVGIASTVGTNVILDGAGIGIGSTNIRKTITWYNATSALMSSENWNLASGKHYEINGTDVLTSTTLGSGVVNSSLTSVGTLGSLTVTNDITANGNIVGDNSTNISGISSVTATTFHGSGANLTSIPNGALTNSSVSYGGVSLSLGDTDATPAFDLSDATNYPTSSLSGTITNAQLAGSIANDKLSNTSVSYGGISLALGASDATPAFDLSDATNYPYTSLTGVSTDIVGDTTPQLGGNLDLNSKDITGIGTINVTGDLLLASTDAGNNANPFIDLYRNSASPALNDALGAIRFYGENDADEKILYGQINGRINDEADGTEDGRLDFYVMSAGNAYSSRLILAGNSSTKFVNQDVLLSQNVDLVFEGASDNTNETTLTVVDPTQDNTITFPDATGTVLLNVVEDTTPQLGGNLDLNSNDITGTGNANITGVVTATSFSGSGSSLTGLTGASAATYGSATIAPVITVDANGRITGITTATISGGGGGTPGGSDGQIQYNNGGSFGGAAQLYYDDVNNRLGLNASSPAYTFDLGESASTIRLVSESGGTAIRMGDGNGNDFTMLRVDGATASHDGESDSAAYGYSFRYLGSGTGNNNKLQILSDNQEGTAVQAFTMLQDGKIGIANTTPSTELEVGGTITATNYTGKIYVDESADDNAEHNLVFIDAAYSSGTQGNTHLDLEIDSGAITFNPSTNTLTVPNIAASLTGVASSATKVYVDESEDDNANYHLMFSDVTPGGGNQYRSLQVDTNGIQFNPSGNHLKVNGSTGSVAIGTNRNTNIDASLEIDHDNISGTPYTNSLITDYNGNIRITAAEPVIELTGSDNGSHAASIYMRNLNEGYAFINNPTTEELELKSFTASANAFNAAGSNGVNVSSINKLLRIGKDGNIGVGDINAAFKLDVDGGVRVSSGSSITFNGPTTTGAFYHASNADTTLLRVTSSGSAANLSGDYGFTLKYLGSGTGNNNALQILSDNQNAGTQVQAFTMLQDGKIGINDTSPSSELEVGGTITATSFVKTGGTSSQYLMADGSTSTGGGGGGSGVASTITVADESSDTTCFPVFSTAATGDVNPKTGSNLTFNSSNGTLTATEFSGGGSGLTGVLKNVVEDTTPQLGGNLDLNSKDITGTGNLNILGVGTFSSLDPISVTIKNSRFLYLGNSNEGSITYDAANLEIATSSGDLNLKGSGSVALYEASSKKLETTGAGVTVTGDLIVSNNARITGILTVGSSSITLNGTDNSIHGFDALIAPPKRADTINISVTVGSKTTANRYYDQGSSNCYFLNGIEAPFLTLTPGRTYRFTLSSSDMTNHPFRLYLEADKTTAYTTNVTSTATYTEIVVNDTTPSVLHYQCSVHSLMGNSVQLNSNKVDTPYRIDGLNGANITGVVTATSFVKSSNSSGFLKADGTEDTNTYLTSLGTAILDGDFTSNGFMKRTGQGTYAVDSNTYLTSYTETDPVVGAINGIVKANGSGTISAATSGTDYLTPSGDGSSLTNLTGASAATYGSSTATPVIVVDANGRITGISTVATSGSGGGGGDTVSITSTAADILSVSSGAISGDDAGADKIVFWDDSASKLTYLTVGTNLSISGTTISASGGGGSSTTRSVNRYVATNNQTLFPPSGTVSYTVGYIDVYLNGSKLDTTEFTASNGTTVTLTTGASANDIVELVAYTSIDVTNVTVVNDTSPQLGGDLDLNGNDITGTGNINITGTATVTGGQVATQNDAIAFAIALG